jgi:hypothetical protein
MQSHDCQEENNHVDTTSQTFETMQADTGSAPEAVP